MVGQEGGFGGGVGGQICRTEVSEDGGDGYKGASGCGVVEERPQEERSGVVVAERVRGEGSDQAGLLLALAWRRTRPQRGRVKLL